MRRITNCFSRLKAAKRSAMVTFITAGDPDFVTSCNILDQLPAAGVDIIELGMPFSDPMAEGVPIQRATSRALAKGHNMVKTLEMVAKLRTRDTKTPVVLMGYYNPIYQYGCERFIDDALDAGVDGLIVVDLPPESDDELCLPAIDKGLAFIRLVTPVTDDARCDKLLHNSSGFIYYVSITGVTGTASPVMSELEQRITWLKGKTDLPVVVGFGIRQAEQVKAAAIKADGVVVGSAVVSVIEREMNDKQKIVANVTEFVRTLTGSDNSNLLKGI